MPYALCPMPYALCTSEHVTEKGYIAVFTSMKYSRGTGHGAVSFARASVLHSTENRCNINSGCTPHDGEWGVGSRPLGNVELLTLT